MPVIRKSTLPKLEKAPTGIHGLDDITTGGLPRGRTSLICGTAGCGKTLFGMEFLVRGALQYNEPGVMIAFEENAEELTENVASLGFDLNKLIRQKKLFIDFIQVDRSQLQEAGEFDLEALFIRLQSAIEEVGAKRVVIDTLETIFSVFSNEAILRSEIRRLFEWLKSRKMTALITAERGDGTLTRHGLEEYVSDCVILLDNRVHEQVSTRRLRVVKYRGSVHGTNEYPFLIDENGISVLPSSSMRLDHKVSSKRVSSGIPRLDAILGGGGYYQGSSVLLSGTAGAGKTSITASFADATCRRGERCLLMTYEESPSQLVRNMASIGIKLDRWIRAGLLRIEAARPTWYGAEMHLVRVHKLVTEFKPTAVIIDPITTFHAIATHFEINAMLTRLIDFLKSHNITAMMTSLTSGGQTVEATEVEVSSLVDTWLLLRNIEFNGERNRGLYILKSRGMAHSNQIREFILSSKGIQLQDVYIGEGQVLTGSARLAQEAQEKSAAAKRRREAKQLEARMARRRSAVEAQIIATQDEFEAELDEIRNKIAEATTREETIVQERSAMAAIRHADQQLNGSLVKSTRGRK